MSDKQLTGLRKADAIDLATGQIPAIAGLLKDIGEKNSLDSAAYVATLPEGVDSKTAAAVHRHDTAFVASSAVAAQTASVAFMAKKANKEVERVTTTFDMTGGMSARHIVKRMAEHPEMTGPDGKVIAAASTTYGATTSTVKIPVSGAKEMLAKHNEANAKLLK